MHYFIIYYHWYVYLLFLGEGEGGGFLWAPRYHCALRGLKWGWVGVFVYICMFLCNSCYIYVVYLLLWKKNLKQKKSFLNIGVTYRICMGKSSMCPDIPSEPIALSGFNLRTNDIIHSFSTGICSIFSFVT